MGKLADLSVEINNLSIEIGLISKQLILRAEYFSQPQSLGLEILNILFEL